MNAVRHRMAMLALVLTATAASWYGMMVVHEAGHVLAAWLSGGRVEGVVLHPFSFSRTDIAENPHPVLVAWAGTVWGSVLPVLAWLAARGLRLRLALLVRFFAGFCLIANGVYLASAAVMPVGDTEDLLRLDVPLWIIVAPGVVLTAAGLLMWNHLGPDFGLGKHSIGRAPIIASSAALAVLLAGMLLWSRLT